MTILVIEDDPSIREVFKTYLCDFLGHRCHACSSVHDATILIKNNVYQIIFLDLFLDGTMATPILDLVKTNYIKNMPKVVILSASVDVKHMANSYGVSFIAKPFTLETIDEIISQNSLQI